MTFNKLVLGSFVLLSTCGCVFADTDDSAKYAESKLTKVFISKNDTQCNADGLSLEETASYLKNANIAIRASECGVITGGPNFAAVCGAGTSNILIHTIDSKDVVEAKKLGFADVMSLSERKRGYSVNACRLVENKY
ncbi:hypothetical protein J3L16_12960 [Alteromonas sp. 5E99-2]|uniref:hypothetical protein n=1 Tax=Alteromonas sp. 5E99-2 TaxID=2817683 RepID=UPI001A99283E|nr:hypothetical protein [Alteromonas sp. 5E99-2]MBO1256596.1 hypothetical protein [Alteromonas sp. 5E99-2]